MRPVYQAVKFSQALYSSSIVLALGLIAMLIFNPSLSALGSIGWWSVVLGMIAGAGLYGVVFVLTKAFLMGSASMRDLMEKLASLFRDFSWPAIVVISIMAGVSEELLLRGLLQNWLVDVFNPTVGIALASLVFGLMHFLTRTYVLVTFALGMVFGVAYYLTDSLVFVMVAHAAYDVLAFAVLVKFPRSLGVR